MRRLMRQVWGWIYNDPFREAEQLRLSSRFQINHPELFELRMQRAQERQAMDRVWAERRKAPVIQFHKSRPRGRAC